jgi:hypothetical protein
VDSVPLDVKTDIVNCPNPREILYKIPDLQHILCRIHASAPHELDGEKSSLPPSSSYFGGGLKVSDTGKALAKMSQNIGKSLASAENRHVLQMSMRLSYLHNASSLTKCTTLILSSGYAI